MSGLDLEISAFQQAFLDDHRRDRRWIIVETTAGFEVHEHTINGVAPSTTYPTKRLAAARLLQLLGVGPVAPQSHPEDICISTIRISDADKTEG